MELLIYLSAILNALILLGVTIFHVFVSIGYPLGDFTMGGKHKILPKPYRFISALSALTLLFMITVFLKQAGVLSLEIPYSKGFAWIFTIFLSINTLANLASKSKKERLIMTPLSTLSFLLCLFITLY
jgi:hypothetical protein